MCLYTCINIPINSLSDKTITNITYIIYQPILSIINVYNHLFIVDNVSTRTYLKKDHYNNNSVECIYKVILTVCKNELIITYT